MSGHEGNSEQWIGRLFHVVSHVMFHFTSRLSHLLPCLVCCVVFAFVGACVFVLVLFPRGVVDDFFFDLVLAGTSQLS